MCELLERIGLATPVVQAGMGGGLSRHELAAAVSEAGGLGTIAVGGAETIAAEIAAARELTDKPIAVNVLLPFARGDWFPAAAAADVVVTFWGRPRRRTAGVWLHQVGSVKEALAAKRAGADGLIVQGVEAGGHVLGTIPARELFERVRAAVGPDVPLLLAGGIAERADVADALAAGAAAAVAGTRFLMSEESRAHPQYLARCVQADRTLLTELFGFFWPAPVRVIPNPTTDHWIGREDARGPRRMLALNALTGPFTRWAPPKLGNRLYLRQRPESLLLTPFTVTDDRPAELLDVSAIYAGETVTRISDVRPAAELVAALTP